MAETTMGIVVPVPAGTLTDEDYEKLIDAMPSTTTEVAEPVAVESEKPVDGPIVVTEAPKPKRVCSKCGHADGNSVGRIKRGRIGRKWDNTRGIWVYFMDWLCQSCIDKESLAEAECDPRPILVSGQLYAHVIGQNKAECKRHEARLAEERYLGIVAVWREILEDKKAFQGHEAEIGQCEFDRCDQPVDPDICAVVDGVLRRFCADHGSALREVKIKTRNQDPRFVAWRGPREAMAKCRAHMKWFAERAAEEERLRTPASVADVSKFRTAFRHDDDPPAVTKSDESKKAKERQAAYAAALRNGGSLADVLAVPEKALDSDDNGWAAIDAHNRAVEAHCAGKRKKSGGKKDGKGKGGKKR
jgi:hypothetical protein